jgi:hypothetical protein
MKLRRIALIFDLICWEKVEGGNLRRIGRRLRIGEKDSIVLDD